jgi:predicted aspartyl protease
MAQQLTALLWFLSLAAAPVRGVEPDFEVPFDFLHNQIVLRVAINGETPFNVILDSGTHLTTIDLAVARRLRMPLRPAKQASKGAGDKRMFASLTTCNELSAGGLTALNVPAAVLDLADISQMLGRPLHGVLGFDFVAPRVTQIDYFHRRIRFYSRSPFPQAPDTSRRISFPMAFREQSVLPVLEDCYVNGKKIPVTLDTGSSLGLILFPEAIRHLGLEELARAGLRLEAAGYLGRARLTKGFVRSLSLKTMDLGAIEVAFVERGYGDTESLTRRGGNIGNAVLQDFVLTLDYPNRMVTLEAVEE